VPNFQISRDETLENKPITFVRKRVETHLQQCRIPKFSGGGLPDDPLQGGGEREEGRSVSEKRSGEGRGGDGEVGKEEVERKG
jgi:hypothetical protein